MSCLKNQSGFIQTLILVLLIGGIALGVYLTQQKTNLFPKAQVNTSFVVKPYLVYPSDKPMYPQYENAVNSYLKELQNWYLGQVGKTFNMVPLQVVRSSKDYLTIRCGRDPSAECINNPGLLKGNAWGDYIDAAGGWRPNTATLIFGAGIGGVAGSNFLVNTYSGVAMTGDWVLEPISGVANEWGIPCKYSEGWQCRGGVPKGSPAHELGHAFGLPHPGEQYIGKTIMQWHGDYPSVGLLQQEKDYLKDTSPFFGGQITSGCLCLNGITYRGQYCEQEPGSACQTTYQVPYCQDTNKLVTSDGSIADCSVVGKKCVGVPGAARCTYQVPYCQDSTNLIASDGFIADCSAVGKKCVGQPGTAKCDVAGAAAPQQPGGNQTPQTPTTPQRPGSPGAAAPSTGGGSSTQQQVPDPAECRQRTACIYSQAPNQCFQGAQLDKTKPAGFNVNCGYVQICTKTSYSSNLLGASVTCPGPGAGNTFNVRDIPFAGILLGPDTGTIADLRAEAAKRLAELNDFGVDLNILAQKTTDPLVQRLIAIAQGRASTSVSSINACK